MRFISHNVGIIQFGFQIRSDIYALVEAAQQQLNCWVVSSHTLFETAKTTEST